MGECHYQVGNYDAMGVNALILQVLERVGIKPERFSLQWASAAEAPRFVRLITEFTQNIKELGPLGAAEGLEADEIKGRLEQALQVVSDKKLRTSFGNTTKTIRKEGNFTQEFISGVVADKMAKSLDKAFGG